MNKVGSDLITTRRVIFTPNVEIKEELAKTSINITCYDRNGDIVKRVTSSDDGTVEDPEGGGDPSTGSGQANGGGDPSTGGSGQASGGDSGSGSGNSGSGSGSGSVTPTVNAPNFSGATQFEESTQVTMSAEAGATIHYTLDGSTPTASTGTVYSGPVTLTETTTVKAIAVKDGVSSSVTSRVYTKGGNGGGDGDGEGSGDME